MPFIIIIFVILSIVGIFSLFYFKRKTILKLTNDEYNLLSKRKFDKYELRSFLVRGDFNSTFLGFDSNKNKLVAVRILHRKLTSVSNVVQQFFLKGEMLKYLAEKYPSSHFIENISYGTTYFGDEPRPYIVTDYITGIPLSKVLEKYRRLSPKDILNVVAQLAIILGMANSQRIWIRDLYPGNIVLSLDKLGHLIVTLVNVGVPFKNLPTDEAVRIKKGYYSPEDRKGDVVSEQSDIYALAALVFRMLEGFGISDRDEEKPFSDISMVLESALTDNIYKRPTTIEMFLHSLDSLNTYKSSVKDLRWNTIIPSFLKEQAEIKVKQSGQESISRVPWKMQIIPKKTQEKLVGAFITGVVTAFVLWVGKKIESILSSPKKTIGAAIIGIAGIAFALWYFVFAPPKTLLTVLTAPTGANILVNNIQVGVTPLENYKADSGSTKLFIRKEGYFSKDTGISLREGEELSLSFSLDSAANVSISVNPLDAIVALDGDTIPQSKLGYLEKAIGGYQIGISREGYQSFISSVYLKKGFNPLEYTLLPLTQTTPILKIVSDPIGATIWIDDQREGKTPYDNWSLTPNSYKIKIASDGYMDTTFNLVIQKGIPNAYNFTLVPSGSLSIISSPQGAVVLIDGKEKGSTPMELMQIASKKYKIGLRKDGFNNFDTTLNILHKQSFALNYNLKPLLGKLKIRLIPYGTIYIDDQIQKTDAQGTFTFDNITLGSHRLKVIHPQYGRWERNTTVKEDGIAEETFDWEKFATISVIAFDENGKSFEGAEILVDEKFENKYTPKEIKVRYGLRRLEIRHKDYINPEGPKEIIFEDNYQKRITFTLNKIK